MTVDNHLQFQLQELNPPVPPQADVLAQTLALDPVPLAVREQRVANGSKRKRDIAAVQMAEELEALERLAEASTAVGDAWTLAADRLRDALPSSTFALWLEPLAPLAADGDVLILAVPSSAKRWVERRYSHLICEALEGSGFSSVRFVAGGEG